MTQPVISNIIVLGPNHCVGTTVNSNFRDAIHFTQDGAGKIYNPVFSAWNTTNTPSGLLIDNAASIAQTASNNLEFSFNSFDNSGSTPYSSGSAPWTSGCSLTMTAWLNGTGSALCRESGNQFTVATLGYDPSFCDDFCDNFTPNFVLGTTSLSAPNFTWDSSSAFSHVTYRGAFGSTDFTAGWTQWCPESIIYCM